MKSLEEIMREKQQVKQHEEEKLQREAAAVPSPAAKATKEKTPVSGNPEPTVVSGSAHQLAKRVAVKSVEGRVETPGKDAAVTPGKQAAHLLERKAKSECRLWVLELLQVTFGKEVRR